MPERMDSKINQFPNLKETYFSIKEYLKAKYSNIVFSNTKNYLGVKYVGKGYNLFWVSILDEETLKIKFRINIEEKSTRVYNIETYMVRNFEDFLELTDLIDEKINDTKVNIINYKYINRSIIFSTYELNSNSVELSLKDFIDFLKGEEKLNHFNRVLGYRSLSNVEKDIIESSIENLIKREYINLKENNGKFMYGTLTQKSKDKIKEEIKKLKQCKESVKRFPKLANKGKDKEVTDDFNVRIIDILHMIYPNSIVSNEIIKTKRRKKILMLKIVEGLTLDKIGDEFNISKERVKQIIDREIKSFLKCGSIEDELNEIKGILSKYSHVKVTTILDILYGDNYDKEISEECYIRFINILLYAKFNEKDVRIQD